MDPDAISGRGGRTGCRLLLGQNKISYFSIIIFLAVNIFVSTVKIHNEFGSKYCESNGLFPPSMEYVRKDSPKPPTKLGIRTDKITTSARATISRSEHKDMQGEVNHNQGQSVADILRSPIPISDVEDFVHVPGGVIVSKVHGIDHWKHLMQSLCLLTIAYNTRTKYDIVIFATEKIPPHYVDALQHVVNPANLTIVFDNLTLQDHITAMTHEQVAILMKRCHVNSTNELNWETRCVEEDSHAASLKYLWQAEFRSKHLWYQDALKPYKYMMWFDSDAMAMQMWHQDPMATIARHELAILYANFPWGMSKGRKFFERIQAALGVNLCAIDFDSKKGIMVPRYSPNEDGSCTRYMYNQVHGFFHLTNLDFYRSKLPLQWANTLIGDTKFSRQFDDQIGITVPSAVLAPDKAWDMTKHGIDLKILHNGNVNGRAPNIDGWYMSYWKENKTSSFPEAIDKCDRHVTVPGR